MTTVARQRLVYNRTVNASHVASATEESGVIIKPPDEAAANKGKIRCDAAGSPSAAQSLSCAVSKAGHVGSAKFVVCPDPDSDDTCFGQSGVHELAGAYELVNGVDMSPPAQIAWDKDRAKAYLAYAVNTIPSALKYHIYDRSTRAWGAAITIDTAIDIDANGEPVATYFDRPTGLLFVYAGGKVYSCVDPTAATPVWTSSDDLELTGSPENVSICRIAGALHLLYVDQTNNDVRRSWSFDDGNSWATDVLVLEGGGDITVPTSLSVAVSPLTGQVYMLVSDADSAPPASDYSLRLYSSGDGVTWDAVNSDIGDFSGSAKFPNWSCLFFDQQGQMHLVWSDVNSGYQLTTAMSRDNGATLSETQLSLLAFASGNNAILDGMWACDIGDETLLSIGLYASSDAKHSIIVGSCRQWSNVTLDGGLNAAGWVTNELNEPDDFGAGKTPAGSGTFTAGSAYSTFSSALVKSDQIFYTFDLGDGDRRPVYVRWAMKADPDVEYYEKAVALKIQYLNPDLLHNVYIQVWHGASGIRLAKGDVEHDDFLHDFSSDFHEFLLVFGDLYPDVSGNYTPVRLYYRSLDAGDMPLNPWVLAAEIAEENTDLNLGDDSLVQFGHFIKTTGDDYSCDTYWKYVLVGDEDYAGVYQQFYDDDTWSHKNTISDPSSLEGRLCSRLPSEIQNNLYVGWSGGNARFADRFDVETGYRFAKENLFLTPKSREWRSSDDEQEIIILFHEDDDRPFRPEYFAMWGRNFGRFFVEASPDGSFAQTSAMIRGNNQQHDNPPANSEKIILPTPAPTDGESTVSYSFWIYPATWPGTSAWEIIYIAYYDSARGVYIDIEELVGIKYIRWQINNGVSWTGRATLADAGIVANQWSHCAFVMSGSSSRLWVNNNEVTLTESGTHPGSLSPNPINDHCIGGAQFDYGSNESFKGKIAQFRVYTKALSTAEIAALYNSGLGLQSEVSDGDLVQEYLFEAQTGSTAYDTAGSYDGTIYGGDWFEEQLLLPGNGFSIEVDDGFADTDNAIGDIVPVMKVVDAEVDRLELIATNAEAAALWAGRFDSVDRPDGRRYYMRVLLGGAAGNVYLVESVTRIGSTSSWAVRLAAAYDGSATDLVTDGMQANDYVAIFGGDIAVQCMSVGITTGWPYLRLRIPSQKTYEGFYRLGNVLFGPSVDMQPARETKNPVPGHTIEFVENVTEDAGVDGTSYRSRLGNQRRRIQQVWNGIPGRENLVNPIGSVLDSLGRHSLVAILDSGRTHSYGSPVDARIIHYDPVLCRVVDQVRQTTQEVQEPYNSHYLGSSVIGSRVSLSATFEEVL